jgi:YD repeat-containing protein
VVSYAYTDGGELASVTPGSGAVATSYTYDAAGRPVTATRRVAMTASYTTDLTTAWSYDLGSRVTALTHSRVYTPQSGTPSSLNWLALAHSYDAVGNRTSETEGGSFTTTYAYDALNRLTQVAPSGQPATSYSYDAVGNRLTKSGPTWTYSYDAADRLTAEGSGAGAKSYSYDARGNQAWSLKNTLLTTYSYDALDRLVAVARPGTAAQASYVYNGDGLRLQETVYGATTSFVWDVAAGVSQLLRASGPVTVHDYVLGLGLAVQVAVSGQDAVTLYPLSDALGSVRAGGR